MRFRWGVIVGFAAGYVLGSRAGRERYEQIRRWWGQFTGSPTVHRATERAREMAGQQSKRALYSPATVHQLAFGPCRDPPSGR